MNILLKSAKIVCPENKELHLKTRDILIKKGIIEKIGAKIESPANTKLLDLENLHVSLGWFDSGVSFGEPGFEERETIANGLYVAGKSGFTDIVLNPNTQPVPDTSSNVVFLKERGLGKPTNIHPLGTLTKNAEGVDLAELFDMKNAGAVAYYDFKRQISNANLLKIALLYAQNFGGLVYSFPQDGSIKGHGVAHEGEVSTILGLKGIPALAEELQIARDLFILEYTGGKLHIPTISTAGSVKLIANAKKKGLDVSCSVAIHNLFFTDETLKGFDTHFKVSPPLRTKSDTKALIKGLKDGSIDFVTTDHIPMDVEHKRVEFDNAKNGSLGLESAFGSLNTLFELDETISFLTQGRARFGVACPKLEEGAEANLTLFNPEGTYTFEDKDILSTSKNSMYLGAELKGKVYGIINNDQIVL
ncbi:dihydroorotase [Flagellimonas zhangzhouensis]|uniref:Dihydroorotase n=1 Tax=Flagellimonas zhangzhouensis TaxID=1073328 RepID=A0A1H2SRN7_9FLAO|nr:dihydroorotase [Allomuricauda zhangzhouensis]SDQ78382.1 dihydroorotase [Allomuricauda zhangzhouensis]SDW34282.1 dihydroorotase [Allomuricauda zhangzhouensis]